MHPIVVLELGLQHVEIFVFVAKSDVRVWIFVENLLLEDVTMR